VSDSAAALGGLDVACRALAAGQPVVLPNPTPLAYIVVATSAREVNRIKGRPLEQNAGITLHDDADWRALEPALDLTPEGLARMRALMRRDLLSFLAPVREGAELPEWIRPAVRGGRLGLFGGWHPLDPLWQRFPRLFGSSANRTGRPPVASAAEAAAVFGGAVVVVDGDTLRDATRTRGATTIVRIEPDGTLALHRSGAHDAGLSVDEFLRRMNTSAPEPSSGRLSRPPRPGDEPRSRRA
jgi:L-threonylcarbamoyladenylate synthase